MVIVKRVVLIRADGTRRDLSFTTQGNRVLHEPVTLQEGESIELDVDLTVPAAQTHGCGTAMVRGVFGAWVCPACDPDLLPRDVVEHGVFVNDPPPTAVEYPQEPPMPTGMSHARHSYTPVSQQAEVGLSSGGDVRTAPARGVRGVRARWPWVAPLRALRDEARQLADESLDDSLGAVLRLSADRAERLRRERIEMLFICLLLAFVGWQVAGPLTVVIPAALALWCWGPMRETEYRLLRTIVDRVTALDASLAKVLGRRLQRRSLS